MEEFIWNPWHGCKKYSEGCRNCHVYRGDDRIGKNASEVKKNLDFDFPIKKKRDGTYKIPSGSHVFLCMTSDFFIDEADAWRDDIWCMLRERKDVRFTVITKRILRAAKCFPNDWNDGYDNLTVCCTMENQNECDNRLECFLSLPIQKRIVICEPLLSEIDFKGRLDKTKVSSVIVGGESGENARICKYDWVTDIKRQCVESGVGFGFKQTGARFVKDGKLYRIARKYQHSQARKAKINTFDFWYD